MFRSRDQAAWCDELSKWHHPRATWDNLQLGLRRGRDPRAVVTTTPRKCATLSAILDAEDSVVTGGGTRTNVHLPPAYLRAVEAAYAGTRLGAQELDGVMPTDVEGSLWPAGLVEKSRLGTPAVRPELVEGSPSFSLVRGREGQGSDKLSPNGAVFRFSRIVVGVDPPTSAGGTCGIVVCGREAGESARGVVLDDASIGGASPERWARAVADAAARWGADRVVVEANQGGDMVTSVLRAACPTLPIRAVHASRGKAVRAEPVAALFESGRAVFGGHFPALEAQLAGMTIEGYRGAGGSPDRADAMVWALWALMLEPSPPVPRVSLI